jgi:hypothetical protein
MKLLKVLALGWTICPTLALLLFVWNKESLTCGPTTAKVFETLFIIAALVGCNIFSEINEGTKEKNVDNKS